MARIPRLLVKGEDTVYHIISQNLWGQANYAVESLGSG